MNIVIIPGFTSYPGDTTLTDLNNSLKDAGHQVNIIDWPNFPSNLEEYSLTNTLNFARKKIIELGTENLVIIGVSMGGIVAIYLAEEFKPTKLCLVVSPFQAGTGDDLEGKYKSWKESGFRDITSSKFGKLKIPYSFIEDARKYNALTIIENINCPKLFIVGEQDEKVSMMVSKELYDKASEPKEWLLISGMEHKYKNQPDKLAEVNLKIIDFIESR